MALPSGLRSSTVWRPWVSTNGVSCIIDASGRIVASVKDGNGREIDVSGIASAKVPLRSGRSFYTRFGDLFSMLVMTFVVLMGRANTWCDVEPTLVLIACSTSAETTNCFQRYARQA